MVNLKAPILVTAGVGLAFGLLNAITDVTMDPTRNISGTEGNGTGGDITETVGVTNQNESDDTARIEQQVGCIGVAGEDYDPGELLPYSKSTCIGPGKEGYSIYNVPGLGRRELRNGTK